jgi:hypothetical protein
VDINIRQNTEANDDGNIAPPLGLHIHFYDIHMILQAINRIQTRFGGFAGNALPFHQNTCLMMNV